MEIMNNDYKKVAETVIKNMAKRKITAYYSDTREEAAKRIISLIEDGSSISWGGSMTLEEINIFQKLETNPSYKLLDRSKVSPELVPDLYREAFSSDYYLMSSNAVTLDGKLVNIDGTGNRVAALIYGPKHVIIVVGMNKIAENEEEALTRVKNIASPLNAIRLNKTTPCSKTKSCHDCLTSDCICMQTVITRNSREKGRIHVILVGDSLGY
jgi:L-lactate utilization protein LutB